MILAVSNKNTEIRQICLEAYDSYSSKHMFNQNLFCNCANRSSNLETLNLILEKFPNFFVSDSIILEMVHNFTSSIQDGFFGYP